MQKKITIALDEIIYDGLNKKIGHHNIDKFIQELIRSYIIEPDLESAYAEMAKDEQREKEAMEWAEITFKDIIHEKG